MVSSSHKPSDQFEGFSKLNQEERLTKLRDLSILNDDDLRFLQQSVNPEISKLCEHLIENAIGTYVLPLGLAMHFRIDEKDYVIPMAIEESAVIAAASKTAKWIKACGILTTSTIGKQMIGQIQIAHPKNISKLEMILEQQKERLIKTANLHVVPGLVKRGGGVKSVSIRRVLSASGNQMAVIHVLLDPCDAMGANQVNQVCEFLKKPIEELTGETVTMCILSNLSDTKLTAANIVISQIDPELGIAIEEASLFAESDSYRAATSNKGALNGMDAVVIATGNDWRAVEAGVHAYAARDQQYRSITKWRMINGELTGELIAPITVGIAGGVTRLHPTAQLCLKILKVTTAEELSRIIAAVGLVQNLGALHALTTKGIVQGHMKLHINNLILASGATPEEQILLRPILISFLETHNKLTETDVRICLNKLREKK